MQSLRSELLRKSIHLLGLAVIPLLAWSKPAALVVLGAALLVYLLLEKMGRWQVRVPVVSEVVVASKRLHEMGRYSWAAIFLCVSTMAAILLFDWRSVSYALVQATLADTAAYFVGSTVGRHKLPFNPIKSWEGSTTFLLIALAGGFFFFGSWQVVLVLALAGTVLESIPVRDLDNLLLPFGIAWLATLLV